MCEHYGTINYRHLDSALNNMIYLLALWRSGSWTPIIFESPFQLIYSTILNISHNWMCDIKHFNWPLHQFKWDVSILTCMQVGYNWSCSSKLNQCLFLDSRVIFCMQWFVGYNEKLNVRGQWCINVFHISLAFTS